MSQTQPLPPKKEVALALLERSSVYVHLDPRQDAVVVRAWFKKQPQLVLQVGTEHAACRIPDLRLDEDGMSCTLSFNRAPFFCVVPWSSVFAMVGDDGRGMVWPDDVPAEVARQAQGRTPDGPAAVDVPKAAAVGEEAKREAPKAKRRKRPALAAVPGSEDAAAEAPPPSPPSAPAEPPVAARPAPAPAPAAAPPAMRPIEGGAPRRKRELPPYLRVVK